MSLKPPLALVAILALLAMHDLCVAEDGKQSTWTPDMCSGPDRPSQWLNNKPLVEWCYQHGYVDRPASAKQQAASREDVTTRAGNVMVFDVLNPAGTVNGGTLVPNDDDSSNLIDFPSPLRLFGVDKPSFYINNNGLISFDAAVEQYTPEAFQNTTQPLIGPWWGDVDTRGSPCPATAVDCNQVIWRISNATENAADLTTAKNFLGTPTLPDYVLIVTWYKVGYYDEQTNKLNTFQLMVAKFGTKTAVGYFYDQLQWTTGDASGGTDGLGGIPAYAGFSNGSPSSVLYYNLPGSGTADVLNLVAQSGGTATVPGGLQPGQWVWDTLANEDCSAFVTDGRPCGSLCVLPDQCCTQPNDCPFGAQCPSDGGQCPFACNPNVGCCTSDGQFASNTTICRAATKCTPVVYCSGQNATCPPAQPFADGTPCIQLKPPHQHPYHDEEYPRQHPYHDEEYPPHQDKYRHHRQAQSANANNIDDADYNYDDVTYVSPAGAADAAALQNLFPGLDDVTFWPKCSGRCISSICVVSGSKHECVTNY